MMIQTNIHGTVNILCEAISRTIQVDSGTAVLSD